MPNRDDVLGAAQRMLNADPAASMAGIAEAVGISRATMHRHFDSREALLVELGTRSLDRWEQRLDEAGVEALAAEGDPVRLREALEVLVLADREAVLVAAAQEAGVLRRDLPLRWFGHVTYGLLVAAREAVRIGDIARRDAGQLVLSSLLAGVATP